MRPRVNQPVGYRPTGGRRPSYYYGHRHDYVYYPVAWIDSSTGTSYEPGYYDENGRRYEHVSVAKDGKYDNVVCHCPYCGQDSVLTLDAETAATQSLQCPSCGGPMEIKSALDDYMAGGDADGFGDDGPSAVYDANKQAKRKKRRFWIIVVVLLFLFLCWSAANSGTYSSPQSGYTQTLTALDPNVEIFGETIFLRNVGGNAYEISDAASGSDKILTWSDQDESYYDQQADCYLWYNVDLEPANWQYWYEGISSDYGDYGWMEHDLDGWFIETSRGNWIPLPDKYDSDALWYIDESAPHGNRRPKTPPLRGRFFVLRISVSLRWGEYNRIWERIASMQESYTNRRRKPCSIRNKTCCA